MAETVARRDYDWDAHLVTARIEDARWLMDNGATLEQAAARLGVTRTGLEKLLERNPRSTT